MAELDIIHFVEMCIIGKESEIDVETTVIPDVSMGR